MLGHQSTQNEGTCVTVRSCYSLSSRKRFSAGPMTPPAFNFSFSSGDDVYAFALAMSSTSNRRTTSLGLSKL